MGKKVVFFSDMHINAEINGVLNRKRFDDLIEYCLEKKPDLVINGGDSIDADQIFQDWVGAEFETYLGTPDGAAIKSSLETKLLAGLQGLSSPGPGQFVKTMKKVIGVVNSAGQSLGEEIDKFIGEKQDVWLSPEKAKAQLQVVIGLYKHVSDAVTKLDRAGIKYGFIDGNHDFLEQGKSIKPYYHGIYLGGMQRDFGGLIVKAAVNSCEMTGLSAIFGKQMVNYGLGQGKVDVDVKVADLEARKQKIMSANSLTEEQFTKFVQGQRAELEGYNQMHDEELERLKEGDNPHILVLHKSYRKPVSVGQIRGPESGYAVKTYVEQLKAAGWKGIILSGHYHEGDEDVWKKADGISEFVATPTLFYEIEFDDNNLPVKVNPLDIE